MTSQKVYQAAMYVRLSKEDADVGTAKATSDSIQNQKLLIRDYVKGKEDIEIIREYEDDGYTGSDFDRPGFQSMMDDVRRGIIDCIIVKDACVIIGLNRKSLENTGFGRRSPIFLTKDKWDLMPCRDIG